MLAAIDNNGAFLRRQRTPTPKATILMHAIVDLVREVENAIGEEGTLVWNTGTIHPHPA